PVGRSCYNQDRFAVCRSCLVLGDYPMPAKTLAAIRTAAVLLVLAELTIGFTAGWEQPDLPAKQEQADPSKTKQSGRKPKEEEEETAKPARKVPLRVGDEDLDPNQPLSATKPGAAVDLEQEAKRARHPAVQELFNRLAKPHDVVTMKSGLRTGNVEPLPGFPGSMKSLSLQ